MSFFGGGTDMEFYFRENGGAVLSTTFDKYCYVNVRHLPRFFDYSTELSYSKTERVTEVDDIQHPAIRNAMKLLDMHEIRLTYEADLPARSGLGTSSSFAVGMLNAFYAIKGKYADKKKLADEAIYLERVLCNEAGGWQDQIAASYGGFLVKAMANMIQEAGGLQTDKAREIQKKQLFGIEFDREIYALACANMLIHKDGKTNLEQMDARTETAGNWIKKQKITKVLMNPPYERKYGCMDIVENVLNNLSAHTMCAFILPDKKLEKTSKTQMSRILKYNRLRKVIKLPEDLFFNVGVTTSIFIFETGIAQNKNEFFACWMESDGLATVKNKGRHDVYGRWSDIESKWVDIVMKQTGDDTCQWVNPEEHLSYQMPQKPFEIFEEDFRKTAMDYLMFKKGIDVKSFGEKLLERAMYSSNVEADDEIVTVTMQKGNDSNGKD